MPPRSAESVENIKVAVRCRPLSGKELRASESSIFETTDGNAVLQGPDGAPHRFAFDLVYGPDTQQEQVYAELGAPVLGRAFEGFNGTIFAYGQTGSGKTWSMTGGPTPETAGLIPRMNAALFERVAAETTPTKQFLVTCAFFEIYNEIIYDLLDNGPRKKGGSGLQIKEHPVLGVYVKGLNEMVTASDHEVAALMARGLQSRHTASTMMNAESSRSHSVFTIKLHQKDETDPNNNLFAKINLVDLAGSERAKGTGATGATLREGANINKSLSALGSVINALVEQAKGRKKVFVPYRNSKLTRVLQESLGGNSLCSMLAALSPAACNYDETMSTLRYASRAKSVKVNAVKNEEASQIAKLNREIAELKARLAGGAGADADGQGHTDDARLRELDAIVKQTWADKTQLTQQHEEERQRMLAEREAAARALEEERERQWRLLADKGDVEMTLRHLTLAPQEQAAWLACLAREHEAVERVAEQRSVVRVYRNSLESDVHNWAGVAAADLGTSAMLLRQAHAKLNTLQAEAGRLLDMERAICAEPPALAALVAGHAPVEGLPLVARQVADARAAVVAAFARERAAAFDLGTIATELCGGIRALGAGRDGSLNAVATQILSVLERTQRLSDDISEEVAAGPEPEPAASPPLEPMPAPIQLEDSQLSCSAGAATVACCRLGTDVGPSGAWVAPGAGAGTAYLELALGGDEPVEVTGVAVQGTRRAVAAAHEVHECSTKEAVARAGGGWAGLLGEGVEPDRLLARPPVRFTHDLLVYLCRQTGFAPAVLDAPHPDYSKASKPEKVAAIRTVIDLLGPLPSVSDSTALATNIVTGRRAEATNRLFQDVARAARPPSPNPTLPEPAPAVVTRFQVQTSDDGAEWAVAAESLPGNDLAAPDAVVAHPVAARCRFLRFVPLAWENQVAMRVEVRGVPRAPAATVAAPAPAPVPPAVDGVKVLADGATAVTQLLRVLTSAVSMTSEVVAARRAHERDAEASRAEAMASEKQDLSERLAAAQAANEQLRAQLAEADALRERGVRLQADNERLEARAAALEERLAAADARLADEAARAAEALQAAEELNAERDELYQANEVLAEERDVSRAKEVELFTELSAAKEEVERLESGYVNVTQRLNEARDEVDDMRDLVARYEHTMAITGAAAPLPKSPRVRLVVGESGGAASAGAASAAAPATPATPGSVYDDDDFEEEG